MAIFPWKENKLVQKEGAQDKHKYGEKNKCELRAVLHHR